MGFPVRPKICDLSQRWSRGKFSAGRRCAGQVAGSLPRRQPGTGTRRLRVGVVTPSLHPEVPGRIRIGHQAINGLDEGV